MNKSVNDEVILYKMCRESHGIPDKSYKLRPILGIHFSPNRGKSNKQMVLRTTITYQNKFISIKKKYPKLFNRKIFSDLVQQLSNDFSESIHI